MSWSNSLRFRFGSLFRSSRLEDEMDQEMRSHYEQLVEDFIASGHDEPEARRLAKREFGNIERAKEECRDSWGTRFIFDVWRDVRFAARQLLRSKGFTSICVLTIALAIAASATVFSILDSVLFRPLPYAAPERLVAIWEVAEYGLNNVAGGAYLDWREHSENLEAVMLHAPLSQNLRRDGGAARLHGWEVSASFVDTLGMIPLLGRGFLPSEEQVNGPPVVMLTEESWRARFGADPAIIGSTITLNERPRQVVGVLPADAWLDPKVEFFIPAVLNPDQQFRSGRGSHWAYVFGRLKPGVSAEQLEAELKSIKASLAAEYPEFKRDWSVAVQPLHELVSGEARPALWMVAAAVGLVLLIACANVANLLLARATRRRGELAMRAALGASPSRILRQSLTESLLLAVFGGELGILLSIGGIRLLRAATLDFIPGAMAPALDGRALAASAVLTCGAALLFGILPAWRARKVDLNETLNNGGKSATSGGRTRSQSALVVVEVTLTVVLVISAGLLLRSLANLASEDPGYNVQNTLTFDLTLPSETYRGPEKRISYLATALEKLRVLPGVTAVGSLSASPLADGARGEYVSREDRPETRQDHLASAIYVGGDFFQAMQARLLRGRFLDESDNRTDASRSLVIDETLAVTLFPVEDPIGQLLDFQGNTWEVVGIVAPMNLDPNPRPAGYVYAPHAFFPFFISIVTRSTLGQADLIESVRKAIASIDSGVPMANARTLDDALEKTREERRFILALIGGFAAIALLLACTGLYGVMSYTTATRQRELCIRRALGASARSVVGLVMKDGGRLTVIGLFIGLLSAGAATRALSTELYQVSRYDPVVITATLTLFACVSLFACWAPAMRAARIDPSVGLRSE